MLIPRRTPKAASSTVLTALACVGWHRTGVRRLRHQSGCIATDRKIEAARIAVTIMAMAVRSGSTTRTLPTESPQET